LIGYPATNIPDSPRTDIGRLPQNKLLFQTSLSCCSMHADASRQKAQRSCVWLFSVTPRNKGVRSGLIFTNCFREISTNWDDGWHRKYHFDAAIHFWARITRQNKSNTQTKRLIQVCFLRSQIATIVNTNSHSKHNHHKLNTKTLFPYSISLSFTGVLILGLTPESPCGCSWYVTCPKRRLKYPSFSN
jgi:hypothetical protein